MDEKRRVFLLGLDGGDLELVKKFVSEGHLPNFAGIMAGGMAEPLESVIPNSTPPAWTTVITGKNPGKHGVYAFLRRKPDSYENTWSLGTGSCKSLFAILSGAGRKVVAVDVPMTYPPEEVNGAMVSGFGTPNVESAFVHPPELKEAVLAASGTPYMIDVVLPDMESHDKTAVEKFIRDTGNVAEQRMRIADMLMDKVDWDLFMLVITGTDRISHAFWKHMDETHPRHEPESGYKNEIRDFYARVDGYLGRLLGKLDDESILMVCSDHGSKASYGSFDLASWLVDAGFIKAVGKVSALPEKIRCPDGSMNPVFAVEQRESSEVRIFDGVDGKLAELETSAADTFSGITLNLSGLELDSGYTLEVEARGSKPGMLFEFVEDSGGSAPALHPRALGDQYFEYKCNFTPRKESLQFALRNSSYGGNPAGVVTIKGIQLRCGFHWKECVAYRVPTLPGVYLNVVGREPHGAVPLEDYERVRNSIMDRLNAVRCEKTGSPLLRVFKREELYAGEKLAEAPDIMAIPEIFPGAASKYIVIPRGWSGMHRHHGLLIVFGPGTAHRVAPSLLEKLLVRLGLRKGRTPQLADIAPTVLSALSVPIPPGMDGRPLFDFKASAAPAGKRHAGNAAKTRAMYDDEDAALEERLKKLGYMD
ncbi:MAG: alkaline phosphatase family protein [Candidatus ainarchaeum sp.]|nr:alkaline phosphatase family protein [Candidatus ainarchaeum sp.]